MSEPNVPESAASLDEVIAGLMPSSQSVEPLPVQEAEAEKPAQEPDRVAQLESRLAEVAKAAEMAEQRRVESERNFYREAQARQRAEDEFRRNQAQQQARAQFFEQQRQMQVAPPQFSDDDVIQNPSKVRAELARYTQQVNSRIAASDYNVAQALSQYQSDRAAQLEREAERARAEVRKQLEDQGYDDFDEVWEARMRPEFEAAGDIGQQLKADPKQLRRSFLIHRDELKGLQPTRPKSPVGPSTPANPSVRNGRGASPRTMPPQLSAEVRKLYNALGVDMSKPLTAEEQAIIDASAFSR